MSNLDTERSGHEKSDSRLGPGLHPAGNQPLELSRLREADFRRPRAARPLLTLTSPHRLLARVLVVSKKADVADKLREGNFSF